VPVVQTTSCQCVRASPCSYTLYSLVPRGILIHLICSGLVIHHFSTKEKHMQAIEEMAHILRVGSQIMMHVWATEQKWRRFEKQDVFVPWNTSTPSCSSDKPCSHGVQKSILHKDKDLTLKQPHHKLDGTSEVHRTARSSSCGEEKKAPCTVLEKSLRWSLFSRSLDSVLALGNSQWHQEELISYCNYSIQLNELKREKTKLKNPECSFPKCTSHFFLHCKLSFKNTTAFEVAVKPVLPMSPCCSKAFRSCYSELGQATIQLPMAAVTLHGCSRVCLPDLISHQKELAVRQPLKIDHHPKQGAFCQPQNKSRVGSSLQETVNDCALATPSTQQRGPGGPGGEYHVFKKGSFELIGHHIPELQITHSYFDHANWCVITENTEVWKM
ncbi:LOW QUALITY PROTEIN: putative tRNA methyltransferase 9B, partial [Guaruba guarouba]